MIRLAFLLLLAALIIVTYAWGISAYTRRQTTRRIAARESSIAQHMDQIEQSYDQAEEDLYAGLQALEPRIPYEPPPRWPTINGPTETPDEFVTIFSATSIVPLIIPQPPQMPPGDDPRSGRPIRTYLG